MRGNLLLKETDGHEEVGLAAPDANFVQIIHGLSRNPLSVNKQE